MIKNVNNVAINERLLKLHLNKFENSEKKGWCGKNGAQAELTLRLSLQKKLGAEDYYTSTKWEDVYLTLPDGRTVLVEVKVGGGTIGYCQRIGKLKYDADDRKPENVLPGVDVVFYIPRPSNSLDFDSLIDEGIALNRTEFINFLAQNAGKRKKSLATATKFNKNMTEINIQSVYIDNLASAIEEGEYDTIRTFLTDNGLL